MKKKGKRTLIQKVPFRLSKVNYRPSRKEKEDKEREKE